MPICHPSALRVLVLSAVLALVCASPANASILSSAKKLAKSAASGTKSAAGTVAKTATGAEKATAGAATSGVAALTADEKKVVAEVKSDSKAAYAATYSASKSAYNASAAEVKKGLNAAKRAALKAAASAQMSKYSGFIKSLKGKLVALEKDTASEKLLQRIAKAASTRKMDATARADFQALGEKLGLIEGKAGSIVPSNPGHAFKSAWGVELGGEFAEGIGIGVSIGFIGNCFLDNGKYNAGTFITMNGIAGNAAGGSASIRVFWAPEEVKAGGNGAIGVGFLLPSAPEDAGFALSVSMEWGLEVGMSGPEKAIPAIHIGIATPGEAKEGAIEGGYTLISTGNN